MIRLAAAGYEAELAPERGGALLRFDFGGEPLFHPVRGPGIFDTASFALIPFSNRVAHGRFEADGHAVSLAPNFPGSDHPHPLHGFGWLARWDVVEASDAHAQMRYRYTGSEWPWAFDAVQHIALGSDGLDMRLALTNRSSAAMPFGLGFHPYFPRDNDTYYTGLHSGEWQTAADGLPVRLDTRAAPRDWWDGRPVGDRSVDTVYAGREGTLRIAWPRRRLAVSIAPSANLDHSVVYTPENADFFCVEPVSHRTDAFNQRPGDPPLPMLDPGETASAAVRVRAERLAA